MLAKTFAAALTRGNHHVLRAQDAQSAINATDSVRPDCIILEISLPGHNGIEFLYELRSHADWQTIPVVIQSQLRLDQIGLDELRMQDLGVAGYCYKPETSLTTLCVLVDDILRRGLSHE